jgi:hypothetical protein
VEVSAEDVDRVVGELASSRSPPPPAQTRLDSTIPNYGCSTKRLGLHRHDVDQAVETMEVGGIACVEPGRVRVGGRCDEKIH